MLAPDEPPSVVYHACHLEYSYLFVSKSRGRGLRKGGKRLGRWRGHQSCVEKRVEEMPRYKRVSCHTIQTITLIDDF